MLPWKSALFALTFVLAACAPATPPIPEAPAAGDPTRAAQQALAAHLGVPVERITVVGLTAVEWADSCLGIPRLEVRCAMTLTPGFRVDLEVDGQPAEVHTTQDGSGVAIVENQLTWERQGGIAGFCDALTITRGGELLAAACRGDSQPAPLSLADTLTNEETQMWNAWLARLGSVVIVREDPAVADQMRVTLTFAGRGSEQPNEAEQQALLDLAQRLYERASPP